MLEVDSKNESRILVVEDSPMIQKYISAVLEGQQLSYDIAEDGQEALDNYESNTYDLILMDISVPIFDGVEVTRKIRAQSGNQVPIIALTGYTSSTQKDRAMRAGMDDFLVKPFVPDELLAMMRKHVQKVFIKGTKDVDEISSASVDRVGLENLYGGDNEHALDMFLTYQEVMGDELTYLENRFSDGSLDPIKKQIHKIKPMFSMVGLTEISQACGDLEDSFDTLDLATIEQSVFDIIKKAKESSSLVEAEILSIKDILKGTQ